MEKQQRYKSMDICNIIRKEETLMPDFQLLRTQRSGVT